MYVRVQPSDSPWFSKPATLGGTGSPAICKYSLTGNDDEASGVESLGRELIPPNPFWQAKDLDSRRSLVVVLPVSVPA